MYRLPATTYLDEALICKFIKANILTAERHNRLRAYYEGKHDILNRWYADPSKPNNKVVNPFPKYITDSYVGYFMGTPCQYDADDEDVAAAIADITEYNDDAAENSALAKIASVNGVAVELLYIDSDKQIRYKASEGEHVLIYDDTIDAELLWAIRYYAVDQVQDNTTEWRVDVYGMTDVRHYKSVNPSAYLELVSVEPHYFGLVPVAVYRNNAEEQGTEGLLRNESQRDCYDGGNQCPEGECKVGVTFDNACASAVFAFFNSAFLAPAGGADGA